MITKLKTTDFTTATLDAITGPTITSIVITDSSYAPIDDTAVDTSGGYISINGTNFVSGCQVYLDSTISTSVTFVNSTKLNVQVPALSSGTYVIYLVNPDGNIAIAINGVTYSAFPAWTTSSTLTAQNPVSITFNANSDSNITYTLEAGSSLPPNLSLSSGGVLTGTATASTTTTYNFNIVATDLELQNASRTFSVTILVSDPFFNYTTLLLSGDTTIGSWISDASTNNFALTVNGDTRPNNFSPYKTIWSNFFDGTGDYLTGPSNAAFAFGTGNFTIEAWVYANTLGTRIIFSNSSGSGTANINFYITSDGKLNANNLNVSQIASTGSITANSWNHVAITKESGIYKFWINGVASGTATSLGTDNLTDTNCWIGARPTPTDFWNGYISNLRVVKGTAVYTSAFTPPTSPLTAITNTSLLTCQSNRLIDNSTNNFTITKNGDVTVSNFGPFVETDITTGSGYFDGTGDFLELTDSSNVLDIGGVVASIECWFYPMAQPAYGILISKGGGAASWSTSNGFEYQLSYTSGTFTVYFNSAGNAGSIANTTTSSLNQWYHVAVATDASNNLSLFVNGTRVATTTNAITKPTTRTSVRIGNDVSASHPTGYISNMRIIVGTGAYSASVSTITVPTSSLAAITNTRLLTLQYPQGENNNRFIDTSGINNIITRNGNATQGTFTPFSQTGWSNYFASGAVLNLNGGTPLTFGTGDFTIEFWVYYNGGLTADVALYDSRDNVSGNGVYPLLYSNPTGKMVYYVSSAARITSTTSLVVGTWYHVALARSGTSTKLFINGIQEGSTYSDSNNYLLGTNRPTIGAAGISLGADPLNGYMSNVRVVKGRAVYTSAFTPPTEPLGATSGGQNPPTGTQTSLLTCQSNRFVDNGGLVTPNTISVAGGSPSVQAFSPFAPTAAYSAATVGGSGYFDGTGDNLTVPTNAANSVGSGSFYFEAWVYLTNPSVAQMIIADPSNTGGLFVGLNIDGGSRFTIGRTAVGVDNLVTVTWIGNQWYHLAVNRNGSSLQFFVNGTQVGSTGTNSVNYPSVGYRVGAEQAAGSAALTGYISGLRLVKSSVNTTNFTPPTAPPDASTAALCLQFTNAGITDATAKNDLETVGNAQISTTQSKFGGSSMYFDGTGDYLTAPNNTLCQFLTGDYTIECWIYVSAVKEVGIFDTRNAALSTTGVALALDASNYPFVFVNNAKLFTSSTAISTNTWTHIAIAKVSNVITLYINGTKPTTGSGTSTTSMTDSTITIGSVIDYRDTTSTYKLNGYIDDLRITKGYARYTTNFTPPTTPFLTR